MASLKNFFFTPVKLLSEVLFVPPLATAALQRRQLKQYCVEQLGSTYSNEVLQGYLPPGKCEYARGSYSANVCVDYISKMEGGVFASNKFLQRTASFRLPPSLSESFQDPFYNRILQLRESKVALACSACLLRLGVRERGA